MLITAVLMSAVLTGPTAWDPAGPQDGVVATAPATAVALDATEGPAPLPAPTPTAVDGLTSDEQIARWLTARSVDPTPLDGSPVWRDDRQPHGQVSVGVGTGGYRDYGVAMSLPIGESGRLDLSYRQVENGYPYGYGHDAYGYGGYDAGGLTYPRSRMGAGYGYGVGSAADDGRSRRWPEIGPQTSDQP
ncbi:MAG: hypothetical protein ACK4JY_13710 [Brevundimonas sp.]|uniref:hypothetical protein n=1 Tax=Brevundimonas sp. TaxID=1871086 RepID=UPI00391BDE06